MSTGLQMMSSHFEVGINAVADAFASTVYTDIVSMKFHNRVRFIAHWGVGATGTSTFTVEACDDVAGSNVSAVAFHYRITVGAAAPGAVTAATSAGFLSTAGSNQIVEIEVPAENLLASGYSYVRLKAVEGTASARLGGVLIEMLEPAFPNKVQGSSVT
jgi:hypothetical protein